MKRRVALIFFLGLFIALIPLSAAFAGEPQTTELSLDQAISRALSNSKAVERAVLDVVYADEVRDDVAAMWRPEWTTTYVPGTEQIYAALLSTDFSYEAAQKKEELQRDLVRAEVQMRYYDILKYLDLIEAKENELAAEEKKFNVTKAMFEVGMVPRIAFDQASMQLEQKRAELASLENDLDNAYFLFNQLVGLKSEDRPVLTDKPVWENLNITSLDAAVATIVDNNPAQWIADEGADLQENLIGFTDSSDEANIKADQGKIDADKLRDDTRKGVYKIYYGIKSLEENYQTLNTAVQLAEDNLRITRLKYEVGMATAADVASAEANLKSAQEKLFEMTCRHELMKVFFYKPWTASLMAS